MELKNVCPCCGESHLVEEEIVEKTSVITAEVKQKLSDSNIEFG